MSDCTQRPTTVYIFGDTADPFKPRRVLIVSSRFINVMYSEARSSTCSWCFLLHMPSHDIVLRLPTPVVQVE